MLAVVYRSSNCYMHSETPNGRKSCILSQSESAVYFFLTNSQFPRLQFKIHILFYGEKKKEKERKSLRLNGFPQQKSVNTVHSFK